MNKINFDVFDRLFKFIANKSETMLLLVDTAEDEINQGNEIKALVRVLLVVLLMAVVASGAIFSIVMVFSQYGLFMKVISGIIASFFLVPIVVLLTYVSKRFIGKNIKKIEKKTREDPDFKKERRSALKQLNKAIVDCVDELNKKANVGVKDEAEYLSLWNLIERYKKLKMELGIYFDGELNEELSILLGTFRKTSGEIGIKVSEGKFKETIRGLENYKFIEQSEKVQSIIAERLRG